MRRISLPLFLLLALLAFSLLPAGVSGARLTVEKDVKSRDISVGDNIDIVLKFSNPFGKPVHIRIQDKNVIAGNGLDIQCYEYTLPPDRESAVSYSQPITAFQPGDFTLGKAAITYTDPETGSEEKVWSNELKLTVRQSQNQQNLQQQGITTVYQCGGMSMTSTSYSSSGSSTSIQISSGFGQQFGQSGQQPGQGARNPGSIQQQEQDMGLLKQQMQEQMQQQEQNKKELESIINQSRGFQRLQEELMKQGYVPYSKSVSPESASSGSFGYTYRNSKGESARISGRIENSTVRDLRKWSREDAERLAMLLENSTRFRRLHNMLVSQGYNITSKSFSEPEGNVSDFDYSYTKPQSSREIAGNITFTGDILSIGISGGESSPLWMLAAVALLVLLALLGVLLYKRKRFLEKKAAADKPAKPEKPFDFRKEALKRIDQAEHLFSEGRMKEAYTKISDGVRIYFKYVLSSGKTEMTSTDILGELKKQGGKCYDEARDCFEICDLVKFARYRPNKRDFRKAAAAGRKVIKVYDRQ